MADTMTASVRLRERYTAEIRGALQEELGLANIMQVPRLEKIVVNMGVGDAAQQAKLPARSRSSPGPGSQSPTSSSARARPSGPR